MSSARRSMSAQSAEAKRKMAGKLSKIAMATTSEHGSAGGEAGQNSATKAAAPFALPIATKAAFAWTAAAAPAPTATAADATFVSLIATLVDAGDLAAQFAALHALVAQVARTLDLTPAKKGGKAVAAAAAAPIEVAPIEPVETISYVMRASLHRGLLDLLTLKLQTSVRTPILRALELLDAPIQAEDPHVPEGDAELFGTTLLERGLSSVFVRMQRAPIIGLVVLFDQILPWKPAMPFLSSRIAAILPAATASLDEILVKRFKTFASGDEAAEAEAAAAADEEDAPSTSAASALWMSPSEQTRFLLRTLVTYLLRYRKELQLLFNQFQSCVDADLQASKTQRDNLRDIAQMIGRIMQHSHVHRDVLTQCGLILTVLLQLSCGATDNLSLGPDGVDQLSAQAIYGVFFAPTGSAIPAELLRRVPVMAWLHSIDGAATSAGLSRNLDSKLQLLSRLAFLRSAATHSSLNVLLKSGLESGVAIGPQDSLLLAHMFPTILSSCKAINPHIRAYSLQSVEVLLLKCKAHIQACGRAEDAVIAALERPIASILELLYSNWDHPFKAIPGIIKGIFIHYIEVRNLLLARDAAEDATAEALQQQREEYWSRFIGQILHREPSSSSSEASSGGLTTSSRGVFTMLLVLMPHISVGSLLRVNPGLLASLFVAAKFRPMFGITNQLIEVILAQAKEEMLIAPRYVEDATAAASNVASSEDAESQRSKQKRKKDVMKQRLKAKAVEAGVVVDEDASSSSPTPAAAALVYTGAYLSQLASWRALWTSHVVSALYSPQAMWRSDVASCTLTQLFKVLDTHEDALDSVLRAIQAVSLSAGTEDENRDLRLRQSRALVTVLKTARRLGMVTSRDLDTRIRNDESAVAGDANARLLPISSSQLVSALLHTDMDLRLEVFEFVCHNLASTEVISRLEFSLLRTALPYLLKISVPNVRAKFVHAVQRFMLRVRDSVNREIREEVLVRERAQTPPNGEADRQAFAEHPQLFSVVSLAVYNRIAPSLRFFEWLEQFLFASLYPSAPFERTCGVLELYRILLDGFVPEAAGSSASSALAPGFNSKVQHANNIAELAHWRVRERVFTPAKTRVLLNLLASNWERVRLVAFELLERFPSPLPGFESADEATALQPLLKWAVGLCRSARMRDAEGGALAVRLLVKKYVVGLRWQLDYEAVAKADGDASSVAAPFAAPTLAATSQDAILHFLHSVHRFLRFQLGVISASPLATRYADPHSRVHGTLLVFRLVLSDVPWGYWDSAPALVAAWREFGGEMLGALKEVAEVSLSLHIPTNAAAALRSEQASTSANMDCRGHPILAPGSSDLALAGDDFADQAGEQIVVVSSWLAVKEVALSLGAWLSAAPLPTSGAPNGGLFSVDQLRTVGSLYFAVLSCSKHNGVLENAHAGFLAVCATLLEAGDPLQSSLVDAWLASLMQLIANPWENDTWIRRSRGIAYCLLAILQAEPTGQKQPAHDGEVGNVTAAEAAMSGSLLGRCMHELMRMARVDNDSTAVAESSSSEPRADMWKLKVHGLNILRAIFRDSVLAVDALPYVAPALTTSIEGFAHPNWNVRNSSLITFCALLSKAVRAQVRSNVSGATTGSGEAEDAATASAALSMVGSKSGMTAGDFFNHFPALHPFLLAQLRVATAGTGIVAADEIQTLQAQDGGLESAGSPVEWGADMHPSLYPILLLLSRLVPSHVEDVAAASVSVASATLDMHAFLPFIRRCSFHPYYMARWMAAKAVVSLVPARELPGFVSRLIRELPAPGTAVNHNHAHGTLLQLHALLKFHHYEAQLLTPQDKAQVATSVLAQLFAPKRAWLASVSMRCALVRLLFLQTVEVCAEYLESASNAGAQVARKRLLVLSASACDAPPLGAAFEGVATDTLRTEAAAIVLRSICCLDADSTKGGDLTGLVIALSRGARSLAVEESLLWTLKRCFTLQPSRMAAHLDLQRVAHHLLHDKLLAHWRDFASTSLSNYTIQELSFQLLIAYEEHRVAAGAVQAQGEFAYKLADHWNEILAYTVNSVDVSVKSSAFTTLSVCLSGEFDVLTNDQASLSVFVSHASTWLELLQAYMDDEQPVALRYACVKAIQSSGLLRGRVQQSSFALATGTDLVAKRVLPPPAFSSTSPLASAALATQHRSVRSICITLWTACIVHLLQDENETVRVDMSTLVGDLVEAASSQEQEENAQAITKVLLSASANGPSHHSGQTLVSRVLEQSFAYVFSLYWADPLLASYLSELIRFYSQFFESVFDNAASTKSVAVSADAAGASALASASAAPAPFKLFEHEKANTVVEELIIMELAAHYLERALERRLRHAQAGAEQAAVRSTIVEALVQASSSFLACLGSFSGSAAAAGGWVGGASFLEAAFVRLYGQVFGLASVVRLAREIAAQEPRAQAQLDLLAKADLTKQGEALHPLLQRALAALDQHLQPTVVGAQLAAVGFLTHVAHGERA